MAKKKQRRKGKQPLGPNLAIFQANPHYILHFHYPRMQTWALHSKMMPFRTLFPISIYIFRHRKAMGTDARRHAQRTEGHLTKCPNFRPFPPCYSLFFRVHFRLPGLREAAFSGSPKKSPIPIRIPRFLVHFPRPAVVPIRIAPLLPPNSPKKVKKRSKKVKMNLQERRSPKPAWETSLLNRPRTIEFIA